MGHTWLIIGSGPSLESCIPRITLERYPNAIAVNNTWERFPWAPYMFFGDQRWWGWYGERLMREYDGQIITTSLKQRGQTSRVERRKMVAKVADLPVRPETLFGVDSGTKAMTLAWRMGAGRLILAGFDRRPGADGRTHFHGGHPRPTPSSDYDKFKPSHAALVSFLRAQNVEINRMDGGGILPYTAP